MIECTKQSAGSACNFDLHGTAARIVEARSIHEISSRALPTKFASIKGLSHPPPECGVHISPFQLDKNVPVSCSSKPDPHRIGLSYISTYEIFCLITQKLERGSEKVSL